MSGRGLNRVELIGNLGAAPELRYTPNGRAVANFRAAVNRRWRDGEGRLQERVEWFRITAWGKLAEIVNQYADKGSQVYVTGRLQTRKYTASDGSDRYVTEVVAEDVILLSRANGHGEAHPAEPWEEDQGDENGMGGEEEDDLPL